MDTAAIAGRPAQTAISKPRDVQRQLSLVKTLTGLAEARQASTSSETLELYAACLSEFDEADVRDVVRAFALSKRAEGDTAFPGLGELYEPLKARKNRRLAQQREARERIEEIAQFWRVVPEWIQHTGQTEEQLLERWPRFKGTKPEADNAK
jgi:hypothetical protein